MARANKRKYFEKFKLAGGVVYQGAETMNGITYTQYGEL